MKREKLLKLEKMNQKYFFDYNCLSPLNKKNFLIWLGNTKGINMNNQKCYEYFHQKYWKMISLYFAEVKKQKGLEDFVFTHFQINYSDLPLEFKTLTFQTSGVIHEREYYLNELTFNIEFNKYWDFLIKSLKDVIDYDISTISNDVFKNAFINMHSIKYNKHNKDLDAYFSDLLGDKPLMSDVYNVDVKYLNNYTLMKFFATTLTCCHSSLYDQNIRNETKHVIKNLYLLLDHVARNKIKNVA